MFNDEYDIEKAFKSIEDELISSMIRNMRRHRAEEIAEGYNWEQWQVKQLKSLEDYKKRNRKKFKSSFSDINSSISAMIQGARQEGNMKEEIKILNAIKKGYKVHGNNASRNSKHVKQTAEFFRLNDRKLEALIRATKKDFTKAEHAMLRMANDQYRKIIFNAQMYANTGTGTYEKAIDMATKDFLSRGINCIEYANGARHTIHYYAAMCLRTATKRAYLTGEGEKRMEWGEHLVILNKRGNACPLCSPFVGKIMIDDVWSGGSSKDGNYMLMSYAVEKGYLHPNCKDSHTTYFPELEDITQYSKEESIKLTNKYNREQKKKYATRQAEKFCRLEECSLDHDNKRAYGKRKEMWNNRSN